ncbi:MAG: Uncharacterised protein [Alphaproteobacteria bacterium]|nr:MAG: Uncharacterised protein [Alphaproteobacteria bacterium]
MKYAKTFYVAAGLLLAPSFSMAAQSVAEWDCGSDGYRVGMAEDIASDATIAISINGASAVSANRLTEIASLVELDGSFTCPPSSSLSITIDSSSYSATID